MQLTNLNIDRIIIHQVYQRGEDGNRIPPTQSHEYTNFDNDAMEEFKTRVKDALGDGSKAVQMQIVNQEPNDLPVLINNLVDQDEVSFAVSSYDVAKKLTDAQHSRSIPGGIVVVFTGTIGQFSKKFFGVIKAEVYSAYEKIIDSNTNEISLKFVQEVLLTPSSRLYKTAGFFENSTYNEDSNDLNDKWTVMISDYQINKVDGKAAARYFYSDFLGCGYPQNSARTTKLFYDSTSSYISNLNVSESKKSDLLNSLITYLKVDNSRSISGSEFAERYFDDIDIQDSFISFMREAGLPNASFTKDIEHIESSLKYRKVNFRSNVKIIATSEAFKDLISIETIDGDSDESGNPVEWTKVIVKDRIINQQ